MPGFWWMRYTLTDQKVQSAKLPEFPRTDFTIGSYATARPNDRRRRKK
jgi:hypothetical protein